MTEVLRVKNEIINSRCVVFAMRVFVLFVVSFLLLDVALFIKEGV